MILSYSNPRQYYTGAQLLHKFASLHFFRKPAPSRSGKIRFLTHEFPIFFAEKHPDDVSWQAESLKTDKPLSFVSKHEP